MQKFTQIFTLGLLLIFGLAISNYASDKYDPEELGFESVEETKTPMGIIKHPGDNDFDMQWDNFDSGDVIADDVSGLTVTDTTNDLDGDGLAEIICSDEDGFTYVFENTGDNSFDLVWSMEVVTSPGSHGYAPVVIADLDGDGLQEIVATFEDSAGIYFYEWDGVVGSDNYTEVAFLDLPYDDYDNTRTMTIDNLDSDINQELIIAHGDTCYVIEADANFNFNIEAKMWGALLDEVHSVITADLNNNGSKEVIYCDWNYSAIHIWENTAEDTYVNVLPDNNGIKLDDEDGRAYEMIITNFDGDSYPEIFAVTSTEKLIVFEMQSSSWDTSASNMMSNILLINGTYDIKGISTGDVDEDGNPDLYFVTDDNHVYDWEYTGGDIFDPINYTSYDIGELNGADAEKIKYAGDLDGDGELELVVGYEGTSSYPLLYFLEHHVIPSVPVLALNPDNINFKTVWNLMDIDTAVVELENIGTVDCIVDSIISSDPVFTYYLSNNTIPALGTGDLEVYFTALSMNNTFSGIHVIYSNSTTSPDTLNLLGVAREKPTLYLNEFQAKGAEWIEIINTGTDTVDLTDIGVTHGVNAFSPPHLFGTPVWSSVEYFATDPDWGPTQSLAPGEILVSFTTGASLTNSQDWLYLVFRDSVIIDGLGYGAVGPCPLLYDFTGDSITAGSAARVAYTGNVATDWTADFDATPGFPNDAPAPALGSSIIINEIDYDERVNPGIEHVEFYNPTGSDITMNGWIFGDGDESFTISGLLVPTMGFAIWTDADTLLNMTSGDNGYLYDDLGVRVDQVGFATFNPHLEKIDGTLQRIPDGAGPNDGYDYWSSGGDITWFDRTPTLGSSNSPVLPTNSIVIFTAQVGGESSYRSFWVNGSWDSLGVYDPNWSGPMLELKNDGFWPDTSAADDIFSGRVQLDVDTTYNWWVGSEHDLGSFLEDGAAITPDTSQFNYSTTCFVDPGDAGFNQWTIGVAGDTINGWTNSDDNLTRNGWEWSGNFSLPAGPMEFKFTVMHSWSAAYGVGGVGGGNIQYTVPSAGDYTITFDDSTDSYSIMETVVSNDLNLTFEDASDIPNWDNWDEPNQWTTFAWDTTGGVGGSGALLLGDGGYGFLAKRPILATPGTYFDLSVDIKTSGWGQPGTYDIYLYVQGIADLDSVLINSEGAFTTFTLSGISTSDSGYISIAGGNTLGHNDVWVDNVVFDDAQVPPDPSIIFADDFEAYTAGTQLTVQNPTGWTTWSGVPGGPDDPFVSNTYAHSGVNSVVISPNDDLVKDFGPMTTGAYSMSFDVYIPNGKAGYFNTLAEFTLPGTFNWGMECYFDVGGGGRVFGGSSTAVPFIFTYDTWNHVEVKVNLEKDLAEFKLNGSVIHSWQWTAGASGGGSPLELDANDFFGATADDEMYFDDYVLREISPAIFADNFDSYAAGAQLTVQNNVGWTTWSGTPGTGEDPYVSNAYANSGANSVVIMPNNDLIKLLGSKTSGVWSTSWNMYIPDGKVGYFNTMAGFTPNPFSWAMWVDFNVGAGAGGAVLDGVPGSPVAFSYAYDTWQHVELVVDLDQDLAELHFDGTLIHQWQWTDGGTTPLRLDATDFYGGSPDDEMYVDDYVFDTADPIVPNSIGDGTAALPITFDLKQNYPNPFNPTTTIKYQLPKKADVKIIIYNMLGQIVRTIIDKSVDAGYQEVVWDGLNETGSRVATGVYIYRMQTKKFVKSHKMIMMK